MLIKYVGQYAPVIISARPDLGPVDRHDIVDVDEDLGILLCEQIENWAPGDDEALTFLEEFWRWVVGHDRVQVVVDDLGNTEMRWVPKPPAEPAPEPAPAEPGAPAEPATDPASTGPEPTSTRARRRGADPDTTPQEG